MEFGTAAILSLCIAWVLVAVAIGFTFYTYSQAKDEISDTNRKYLLTGSITAAASAGFMLLAFIIAAFFGGKAKPDSKDMLKDSLDRQRISDEMTKNSLSQSQMTPNSEVMPMRSKRSGWCRPKNRSRTNMEKIFQDQSPNETVVLEMD